MGEVLLEPQVQEVADIPHHLVGEKQDQAEGDQPGEGVAEAGRAAPRGGDHGVDEVPGDVDEQGGLEAQQELDGDHAERRQSPVGPDVAPGPEQVGGYAAGARAAVPELEIRPRPGSPVHLLTLFLLFNAWSGSVEGRRLGNPGKPGRSRMDYSTGL